MPTREQVNTETPQGLAQKTLTAPIIIAGTMQSTALTGCTTLDPTQPLQLANKQYVDAGGGGGGGGTQVAPGIIEAYSAAVAPTGWLLCNGASYLQSQYAQLFGVIGITYGGDATNFNVPDLRGYFIRGLDQGRGVDTGRVLGSNQVDEFKSHNHFITSENVVFSTAGNQAKLYGGTSTPSGDTGGTETRPVNLALTYIISVGSVSVGTNQLPQGYLFGFTCANNTTDPVNDLDVALGVAKSSSGTFDLTTPQTIIKQIDVAFAEYAAPSIPSGGRDSTTNLTGAKTFHVFMIGGFGKNTQPFLSTSLTPTLPTGFTDQRRVWSILWSGTAIVGFTQTGRECALFTPVFLLATAPPTTAVSRTLAVPIGISVMAHMNIQLQSNAAAGALYVSPLSSQDLQAGNSYTVNPLSAPYNANGGGVATSPGGQIRCRTNTAGQIRTRITNATNEFGIATLGWIDDGDAGVIAGGTVLTAPRAGTPINMTPYVLSAVIALAHGLGAPPDMVKVELTCIIAQGGYQVGDVLQITSGQYMDLNNSASLAGYAIMVTSTTFTLITGATPLRLYSPVNGGLVDPTPANWNLTATPYKLT